MIGWLSSIALVFFKSGYIYWIPLMYKDLGLQPQPFLLQCAKEILQGSVMLHSISRDLWSNVMIQSTDLSVLHPCKRTWNFSQSLCKDLPQGSSQWQIWWTCPCSRSSVMTPHPLIGYSSCWVLCFLVGVGCMKELISLVVVWVRHVHVELSWV